MSDPLDVGLQGATPAMMAGGTLYWCAPCDVRWECHGDAAPCWVCGAPDEEFTWLWSRPLTRS